MFQIIKLVFYVLREMIFDNKDEYDYKSSKFNARKMTFLVLMILSLVLNGWMLYRFIIVSQEFKQIRETPCDCSSPSLKKDGG